MMIMEREVSIRATWVTWWNDMKPAFLNEALINNPIMGRRLGKEEDLKAKEAELIRGNTPLNNATSFHIKKKVG
ncbi:hypothetical protein MRB53_019049 [Persea americana]|uniref:Uncharacterized protein n=1 Tax=Persea americana TaxID=3435 RepID=A0ACC2M9N2_PERAE|nr:hypothetical protein MRB53_019049 [Persea americana]